VAYAPITRMSNSIIRYLVPFLPIIRQMMESYQFYEFLGPDFDTLYNKICEKLGCNPISVDKLDDNGPNNKFWLGLTYLRSSAGSSLKEVLHFA
jgi:hypothetical protein